MLSDYLTQTNTSDNFFASSRTYKAAAQSRVWRLALLPEIGFSDDVFHLAVYNAKSDQIHFSKLFHGSPALI